MGKNNNENYCKIKEYYSNALQLINSGCEFEAGILILDMPVKLYDMSLDIHENKNEEFSDQELRHLIIEVTDKLENFSMSKPELNEDNFDIFDLDDDEEILTQ